jgi:hypothetical protein
MSTTPQFTFYARTSLSLPLLFSLIYAIGMMGVGCEEEASVSTSMTHSTPTGGAPVEGEELPEGGADQLSPFLEREGDPERGYQALVNHAYVSCGIPERLSSFIDMGDESDLIPNRNAQNEDTPFFWTRTTSSEGVDLIVANCLSCHASKIRGEVIIGLGDVFRNYAQDPQPILNTALSFADRLLETDEEREAFEMFVSRSSNIAPFARTLTAGVNPAISITAGIMSHLDPVTFQWNETPLIEVPDAYRSHVIGLNPQPWWSYKKKSTMFYSASGGGSHVVWSMLASSMCLESESQALEIASYFSDILAYIRSIEPPPFPEPIDAQLVEEGALVFEQHCSSCHGTYGLDWTYPNRVVDLEEVGVDPVMAEMMFGASIFHEWIERSPFGEAASATPELGYVAPPLDGVWATAPYLHNGSVPTLAALLDSRLRTPCWTWSYESHDYDFEALGWRASPSLCHQDIEDEAERAWVYDASNVGYGNGGHTFGDALNDRDRDALLEYLKTL